MKSWLKLGLATLLLAGCQSAHMPVPSDADAERMKVYGRQGLKIDESIRFGSFQVTVSERSAVRGPDLVLSEVFERNRRRQRFSFDIQHQDDVSWHSSCDVMLEKHTVRTKVVDIAADDRSRLKCTIAGVEPGVEEWLLVVSTKDASPMQGKLTSGTISMPVNGTNQLQHGLPAEETTGYVISLQDNRFVYVDVLDSGTVWMPVIEQDYRNAVGAAVAALLLYEDLRAHTAEAT
ncbi:MAG: hypothetical protein HKN43_00060 [Rhodothermales bacterium]|nr:hypothetical protein [Rhodothermales bacterium]